MLKKSSSIKNEKLLQKYIFMVIFLAISTAFLIGFLLTPIVILFLKKMELMDSPGGRKIHNGFILVLPRWAVAARRPAPDHAPGH